MKISKLKALTVATVIAGSASLSSIVGLTAVTVLNNQTSENQNYSQTGDSDNNGSVGENQPNEPLKNPVINNEPSNNQPTSSNIQKPEQPIKQPNNLDTPIKPVKTITEADVQKLFRNKKTIQPKKKIFEALNQIKTINDLWKFYSKPTGIPSNFKITLNSLKPTLKTYDSNLGLEVSVSINNKNPKEFLIYGFTPYNSQDYKKAFEDANPSGKFTKDGKYYGYVDWHDLSKNPNDKMYFANYFKPVIPRELSANNIIATPDSFNLLPGNIVNYHYVLHSSNNKISVNACVPVSTYYQYPLYTNGFKTVTKSWKPGNFDFIKANLPNNYSKSDFNKFIWNHWNDSIIIDAINAVRYWYLFDESNLTWYLQQYIFDAFWSTDRYKWTIGYLIAAKFSKGDGAGPHYIWGSADDIKINPTYDSGVGASEDKFTLNLKWHLPNFVEGNFFDWFNVYYGYSKPFNVDASLRIVFDTKKPKSLNSSGIVEIPVTVMTDINNPNKGAHKYAIISKKDSWNILDALYLYFKNNKSLDKSYSTPFFGNFWQTLKKHV